MLSIKRIDHIVLRTSRLDEMLVFYCEVLGCRVERKTSPGIGLTQLRAGEALIDLVTLDSELGRQGGGPPDHGHPNVDHFCLLLEPVTEEAIRQVLRDHGVTGGEFVDRYGAEGVGRSVYVRDPEGNVVELRPAAN